MATVRIYRVAELLNTTSQEVIALLKRDHGIEVRSASSTIEEVVAREFVSRMARQRGLTVPSNTSFADTPAPPKGKKPMHGRAPEPVKPAAPALPPPRLVKSAKPIMAPVEAGEPMYAPEAALISPSPPPEHFVEAEPFADEVLAPAAVSSPVEPVAPSPPVEEPAIAAKASEPEPVEAPLPAPTPPAAPAAPVPAPRAVTPPPA
ncbi:MAG: translation initiation factor IF-2 N-terminal domain-containing protein, partial [Acidobacteria bacterium]|nr:translation initiation factor IF-2 N-terminal domain-containing protein [Acidobacteriota bacterium]